MEEAKAGGTIGGGEIPGAERASRSVERLIDVLTSHLAVHRRLLGLLEEKKGACVQAQVGRLEEIVERERQALEAIADSERERIAATLEVGAALGFPSSTRCRLLDLISRVGEEHREALLDLRDELREVAEEIDRLNRLNRTLVVHSLEHVHLFLSLLRGSDLKAPTYNAGGGESGPADPVLLDRRI